MFGARLGGWAPARPRRGGSRKASRAVAHQNAITILQKAHHTGKDRMRMFEKRSRILVGRGSAHSGATRATHSPWHPTGLVPSSIEADVIVHGQLLIHRLRGT